MLVSDIIHSTPFCGVTRSVRRLRRHPQSQFFPIDSGEAPTIARELQGAPFPQTPWNDCVAGHVGDGSDPSGHIIFEGNPVVPASIACADVRLLIPRGVVNNALVSSDEYGDVWEDDLIELHDEPIRIAFEASCKKTAQSRLVREQDIVDFEITAVQRSKHTFKSFQVECGDF